MSITCKKCGTGNPDDSAIICPHCGVVYAKAASAPQHARYPRDPQPDVADDQPKSRSFSVLNLGLIFIGAAVLAAGCFMPIVSIGVLKFSYYKNGHGDGLYVLILAGLILLGALGKSRPVAGFLGIICLGLISFDLYMATQKISEMQDKVAHDVQGNPFAGLALAVSNSVSLEWGWGVMYLGGILVLLGALLSNRMLKEQYAG